ncbi:MAG: amino acid permease [Pirellulaceae bacterium]
MNRQLFARKKISTDVDHGLKRVLGPLELTLFGVGAIIGTGIFVLTGTAAAGSEGHLGAGPAIVISFVITAVACGLAALCYAEFASMVPVSGSAYTYAYASFGELAAWVIGWDLILEYAVGNIAVAIGWSGYFTHVFEYFGVHLPVWLTMDPMTANRFAAGGENITSEQIELGKHALESAPYLGFPLVFNLPAMTIVFLVTALLIVGVKESAKVNNWLVFLKLGLIALFLFFGIRHVDFGTHWQAFAPNGFSGIMTGSALIFFAYIGFDAVSTTAEEAKNPQRDLPIGMIASLIICTVLYIAVAAVLTGMVPLETLNNEKPVAAALTAVGESRIATVISLGGAFHHQCLGRYAIGSNSDFLCDESRWVIAKETQSRRPSIWNADVFHRNYRFAGCIASRVYRYRCGGRINEHWHPVCVCSGCWWGDGLAKNRSRTKTWFQDPNGLCNRCWLHVDLLIPDAQPAVDDLGTILCLDGDWTCGLLQLWVPP